MSEENKAVDKQNSFQTLMVAIKDGMTGANRGVSMGFERLDRYLTLRKRIYTLIFGPTGSGKSAFAHSAFILHPFEWMKSPLNEGGIKLKFILFSMERSRIYTQAKWMSRHIFINNGILIPIPKLLGWWSGEDGTLSHDEHDLVLTCEDYFNELDEYCEIYEGARSPSDLFRILKTYAEENGKEEQISEHKKIYIPNNSKEIVIPIYDHFGLTKLTRDYPIKKEAIDKVSEHFQYFRDFCGMSPVGVSQMTRDKNNPMYTKLDSFEPTIDDVKESGRPGEDADCVISLFDPMRYKTNDPSFGDVSNFINPETGAKFFRSAKILKNSFGEDDVRFGMAFHGAIGAFKELPKAKVVRDRWTQIDYQHVTSGSYFLS
jgi:hypothetical protein